MNQPPSGGCVLKQDEAEKKAIKAGQPPSGGCVLKLLFSDSRRPFALPAAFGRLCVETIPHCPKY